MATDAPTRAALDEKRTQRNRSIRHALMTSVMARMSGVLLQVVSLPIAAMQLGPAGFSIYAMLAAMLAAMMLSNLGMSQSTTLHMSRALAAGDVKTGREMLTASLAIVGGIALGVSLLAAAIVTLTPLLSLVFSQHLDNAPPPVAAALFVCFVFLATQLLSVLEAAQLAQQRQHRLNIATSIGTLIAAGAVWWVATTIPSVVGILVAMHLPVIAARAINSSYVLADLRPRAADLAAAMRHARPVLGDGLRFVSGTAVSGFFAHHLSIIVVGMFAVSTSSAAFAAVLNAVLLGTVIFNYIMMPLRAALPEAQARGDHDWTRRAFIRVLGANIALASIPAVVFFGFGTPLFEFWYGGSVHPDTVQTKGAGVYVMFLAIEITLFGFLSSLGYLSIASRWLLAKGLVTAVFVFVLSSTGHVIWITWVLVAASALFSIIPLGIISITTQLRVR